MRNASRHLAAYRTGSSHKRLHRRYLRPGMAQPRTLFMQGGSQTPPLLTRPPSTGSNARSSSSRSAFTETLDALGSSRRRPRNTPPYWRPSEDIGEGWSLSPFLSATLVPHSPRPLTSSPPPSPPSARLWRHQYGRLISRHGPQRQDPRLHPVQVVARLAYGLSPFPPLRHH